MEKGPQRQHYDHASYHNCRSSNGELPMRGNDDKSFDQMDQESTEKLFKSQQQLCFNTKQVGIGKGYFKTQDCNSI